MLRVKRGQAAFTLIELLVVVIIVAILAAVGIPLLSGNIERARASEADAGQDVPARQKSQSLKK